MMNKEAEISNEQKEESVVIDQAKIDQAKKAVEDFQEELDGKVYPVKVKTPENLESICNFVKNEANWKNMEALGVIELDKQLVKAELKDGNIFLKALEIDALNYFLGKVEGNGLESALKHIEMVQAVNGAGSLVQADNNRLKQLLVELDAAEQGIEVEPSVNK